MHRFRVQLIAAGLGAAACLSVLSATPCFAQYSPGGTGASGAEAASKRTLRGAQQATKREPAPPPVLPGTKAATEAAAPTVSPADMSPTDGLFDAINRGDAAAARDAVNRGANLDGHNILGLTPLELSVDLGRNDISFLLLSMRGDDPGARRDARTGGDLGITERRAAASARTAARQREMAATSREPEEAVAGTPRLYSGNGGAPIPAAGFLGFDAGRTSR